MSLENTLAPSMRLGSKGFSHSTCSLARNAWTIGAPSRSASPTTSSWAPAHPLPQRIVIASDASSSCTSRSRSLSGGTTAGCGDAVHRTEALFGAGFSAMSPGRLGARRLRVLCAGYRRGGCRVPFMALSGRAKRADECPLSGIKRTWRGLVSMSANDPERTIPSCSGARRALTLGRFVEPLRGHFNCLGECIARVIERLAHGSP
jgi:hypothetical protein